MSNTLFIQPFLSPILAVGIYSFLGMIQFAAFFKSGSISLLGNGIHCCIAIIATCVIFIGVRIKKETVASSLLQLLMGLSGLGVVILSIDQLWFSSLGIKERFIVTGVAQLDRLWPSIFRINKEYLAVGVAIVSILLCTLLFIYQQFNGNRNHNLTILAQAADSGIHIATSFFMFVAVIAGNFGYSVVDGVIGILIGFIIMINSYTPIQGGHAKLILITLNEKPYRHKELVNLFDRIAMRFGSTEYLDDSPHSIFGSKKQRHIWQIEKTLEYLVEEELIQQEGDVYLLTETGKEQAEKAAKGMAYAFKFWRFIDKPSLSPILSLITHFCLGTIKLVGFFIIGSVSLLSDGLDSLMDGISAIVVGISMKVKREIEATYLLLLLMLITGAGTLWQSIERLLNPIALEKETLAFGIAIASIVICTLLYFYQRYSGYKNQNLAILAQSEDSRNHVLNASLVLVAILAGTFKLYFIDGIVGCFIGFLILRGAYELFKDLRAKSQGEDINYDKYKLGIWKYYDRVQSKVLDLWIIKQVEKESMTFPALEQAFNEDFRPFVMIHPEDDPYILDFPHTKEQLQKSIQKMIELGFLEEDGQILCITEAGSIKLHEEIKKRGRRSRSHRY
ncbi:MAG: cation transporter [Candidatus Hodarchaeota archaeon]